MNLREFIESRAKLARAEMRRHGSGVNPNDEYWEQRGRHWAYLEVLDFMDATASTPGDVKCQLCSKKFKTIQICIDHVAAEHEGIGNIYVGPDNISESVDDG